MNRISLKLAAVAAALVTSSAVPHPARAATRLFASGFEPGSALGSAYWCGTSCVRDVTGTDASTGFTWPPRIWGGRAELQELAGPSVSPSTISNYIYNAISVQPNHSGVSSRVLSMQVNQVAGPTQDLYLLQPGTGVAQGDLYISYWLKFQPDMLTKMGRNGWRSFFAWKTTSDYRVEEYVFTDWATGQPYWFIHGDNAANGSLPYQEYWRAENRAVPVPVGQWFKLEVFWHRSSGSDGRVWSAVNGQVLFDHHGPNMGVNGSPISRIMAPLLYSSGAMPISQSVDDLQIWDGFPCGVGVACGPNK